MNKIFLAIISLGLFSSLALAQEQVINTNADEDNFTSAPAPTTDAASSKDITRDTHNDPIDIDATYSDRPQKKLGQADKMKIMRERLEKRNEMLVKKQMEEMRMKQEMEMSKRIQKSFDDSMKKLDAVDSK